MDSNSASGLYKCTVCLKIVAHHQGKEFLPCSNCNKLSWEIIEKDKDYLASLNQNNSE
jgi:DNA-directed RNA polymerase subunit RPC12/RpoP